MWTPEPDSGQPHGSVRYSISPYGRQAGRQIQHLAHLFRPHAKDRSSLDRLLQMAASDDEWHLAHELFVKVRRLYQSTDAPDLRAEYFFIEACLQTLYNETAPADPFDSISPFFVLSAALGLAVNTGVTLEQLAAALAKG